MCQVHCLTEVRGKGGNLPKLILLQKKSEHIFGAWSIFVAAPGIFDKCNDITLHW